jgi:putative oxidoreductase
MPAPSPLARLRNLVLRVAAPLAFLPPLLARIAVGVVFMQTGWGKLHGLGKITDYFTSLGIPAPHFNAVLVASTEFFGGCLLCAGLLTRMAAIPMTITMVVAISTARRKDLGGIADLFGFEEFTYLIVFVWLAIAGPGAASIDRLLGRWFERSDPPPYRRPT